MSLVSHAKAELKSIGMLGSEDEMNTMMSDNIIQLLEVFAEQGHTGFSAPYCIDLFTKLANFKPLGPLTGADDEWAEVTRYNDEVPLYQNKRCSHVFKDADGAYDINGKVFWEWARRPLDEDEPGYPGIHTYKWSYTCRDSRVPVTFPYTIPDEPIYEYRHEHRDGEEAQDEHGFI